MNDRVSSRLINLDSFVMISRQSILAIILVSLAIFAFSSTFGFARAESRIALVIGNGAYKRIAFPEFDLMLTNRKFYCDHDASGVAQVRSILTLLLNRGGLTIDN